MAGPRYTRVWRGASKDVCGASIVEAMWSGAVGKATGGQSFFLAQSLSQDAQT